ncbi:hypothetical protein QA640_43135 [Bradyrhizobium sp. CB82]|uniref:hypothetical protein n=1 Tax=Bradyrhizobium sp. CB82 TaxID=3039159 RepID=UPI0024B06A78|nr:hypothetical protein [Bradyrhizobium sp. CB82]WFU40872.1 hypothetical protein QA640_43135 [Bradyrhizobium sp. CB82]
MRSAIARGRKTLGASSSSRDGDQLPFGGCSPASSLSTFWARALSVFIGPGAGA